MENFNPWGLIAAACALASGCAWGHLLSCSLRRRRSAAAVAAAEGESRLAALLVGGIPVLRPLARRLLTLRQVSEVARCVVDEGRMRGRVVDAEGVVTLAVLVLGATTVFAIGVSGSVACGIAIACCMAAGLFSLAHARLEQRAAVVRDAVPEALRSMSSCFRSGFSLPQTLSQLAGNAPGSLALSFGIAARRLEMGESVSDALSALAEVEGVPELRFVSVALDVQHQTGGSVAPVLDAARESVESELELARSLRVQTAQAKLSAQVVTVMPFILVALFSLMSPGFLAPFFQSLAGVGMLALALGMQLAGVLLVRRMLKIEPR